MKTKKFWSQPSFWVWVVMAVLIVMVVPGLITSALLPVVPTKFSWLEVEILLFFGLLVLWAWPRKYMKQIFFAWLVVAAWVVIKRPSVILPTTPQLSKVLLVVAKYLVFLGLGIWLRKCLAQIGTVEIPCQAVLSRFGKAVDAVGPGLYFCLFPFERFKRFPTGQYHANYAIKQGLYSKEEGDLKKQSLEVDVTMYYRFPKVGNLYSFPVRGITSIGGKGKLVLGRVSGRDLLMKSYDRLPIKDLTTPEAIDQLGKHFEKGVIGATRHAMSSRNSRVCAEEKDKIEQEMKKYLLQEEGNPVFECGLPQECIDIELPKVKVPDETEKAYIKPEIAWRDAEAAKYDEVAIKRRVGAYKQEGVSPDVAGVLAAGKVEGKPVDLGQLRDLSLFLSLPHLFGKGVTGSQQEKTTKT